MTFSFARGRCPNLFDAFCQVVSVMSYTLLGAVVNLCVAVLAGCDFVFDCLTMLLDA